MEMRAEWLERDTIDRRRGLSVEKFIAEHAVPNWPLLLEGCLDSWPALLLSLARPLLHTTHSIFVPLEAL